MTARLRLVAALAWFLAMFNFSVAKPTEGMEPEGTLPATECTECADGLRSAAPEGFGRNRHSDLF